MSETRAAIIELLDAWRVRLRRSPEQNTLSEFESYARCFIELCVAIGLDKSEWRAELAPLIGRFLDHSRHFNGGFASRDEGIAKLIDAFEDDCGMLFGEKRTTDAAALSGLAARSS